MSQYRPVTLQIRTEVASGREQDFRAWFARINAAEAAAPGFLGAALGEPVPGVHDDWTTMLTFDSQANLDRWLASDRRRALVDEAAPMVERQAFRQLASGFEQWFPDAGAERRAPAWKVNLVILTGLYPIVMAEILFLNPLIDPIPLPFATLIGNIISVALLSWPVLTVLNRRLDWWLHPRPGDADVERRGALVLAGMWAIILVVAVVANETVAIDPVTW
ncbi:MAG: antibiotic biosynthesis monooxygenase [Acidimicrobiales bacterium]|nr:antibiotic biosynthesis monooxygenase [Acidimicrobiales bacterium]